MNTGHSLVIVDVNKAAAEPLVRRGASYSDALTGAQDTEFIFFNLPDNAITKKVLEGCAPGRLAGKIIINSTTSAPSAVKEIEKLTADTGAMYLDCKITAYPTDIGTKKGNILYSGSQAAYKKAEPILHALAKPIYLGENVLAATIIDMANIGVYFNIVQAMIQSAALCIQNGVAVEAFIAHIQEALPVYTDGIYKQMQDNLSPYNGQFSDAVYSTLNNEVSSIDTTIQSFQESGVYVANLEVTRELIQAATKAGYGGKDLVALITQVIKPV